MNEEPNLLIRVLLCFSAPKRWAARRQMAATIVWLRTQDYESKEESDKLWIISSDLYTIHEKLWDEEYARWYRFVDKCREIKSVIKK